MTNFFRRLISKIAKKFTRKVINLESEIIRLITDVDVTIDKDVIVESIERSYPGVFSTFEIEYTIDRMACDHKVKTDGYHYARLPDVNKKGKKTTSRK